MAKSKKLFNVVHEGTDPKGRQVIIAEHETKFFVYKPRTGYKSKSFYNAPDEAMEEFDYQINCSQNNAFPFVPTPLSTSDGLGVKPKKEKSKKNVDPIVPVDKKQNKVSNGGSAPSPSGEGRGGASNTEV